MGEELKEPESTSGPLSLFVEWILSSILAWLLCLVFVFLPSYKQFDSGMVPAVILFGLAIIPVSAVSMTLLVGLKISNMFPGRRSNKLLVMLGISFLIFLGVWMLILLCGIDFFVPRI